MREEKRKSNNICFCCTRKRGQEYKSKPREMRKEAWGRDGLLGTPHNDVAVSI